MNQALQLKSSGKLKRTSSLECTCEINHIKAIGKNSLRYSMCDICSEKLFSKNLIHIPTPIVQSQ